MADATESGKKALLDATFIDCGLQDWRSKLVSIYLDEAAVNLGVRCGLATLLRRKVPWLQLELATKSSFSKTFSINVASVLMNLYYLYEKSPKQLCHVTFREMLQTYHLF